MISISKLYNGFKAWGDGLRYGEAKEAFARISIPVKASERKPVVVWNVTRRCNLYCCHCYSASENHEYDNELTTSEGKRLLKDLAGYSVPVVLFSGGEPLMRNDIFELLHEAQKLALRTVISTNGTLIDNEIAQALKKYGVAYVGVSLDGIGENNDRFRGKKGAFDAAVKGIEAAARAGLKVGLRLTLTRHTTASLNTIFEFIKEAPIDRICFYHLVYSGRGRHLVGDELTHQDTRQIIDAIIDFSYESARKGSRKEVLTVDNHVDGVYLYLRMREEGDKEPEKRARAEEVLRLLRWNGGGLYSTGIGIGAIDSAGNAHPDQFWTHYSPGSVRERQFSEIWQDESDPIMYGLRHRRDTIRGRCRLCRWFDACGGSLRVRAELIYSDPCAPDPACYLSDDEIGLDNEKRKELSEPDEIYVVPDFFRSSSHKAGPHV